MTFDRQAAASAVARSYLFVPGSRPERFDKALAAGAHGVIIDLEDAVPLDQKDAARAALAGWLGPQRSVLVRINGAETPWFEDDVRLCAAAGVAGVVLPKAEDAAAIARIRAVNRQAVVLPLIETARGLWQALELGRAPGVQRLLFGALDFQLDLDIRDPDLLHYRGELVLASRLAELLPPVDGVTTTFEDVEVVRRETARARELGFGAKLCIHPKQVAIVNAVFRPSDEERAWAHRVIDADAAAGGHAVAVDGRMVDRPVLLKARRILAEGDGAP